MGPSPARPNEPEWFRDCVVALLQFCTGYSK